MFTRIRRSRAILAVAIVALLLTPTAALADPVADYDFASPIFGLAAAPDGSLLVADAGAGNCRAPQGSGPTDRPPARRDGCRAYRAW